MCISVFVYTHLLSLQVDSSGFHTSAPGVIVFKKESHLTARLLFSNGEICVECIDVTAF